MKKIKFSLVFAALVWPMLSFAVLDQTSNLLQEAKNIITNTVIPLTVALAMLFFLWGLAKYIRSVGTAKEEGKQIMVWGVIALFVMSSVWGIVRWIQGEFELPTSGTAPTNSFKI